MKFIAVALLVLASFNILPTDGIFICPWCEQGLQTRLLDCVHTELTSQPQLFTMPLQEINTIKWKVSSESDAMTGAPYVDRKVKIDGVFMTAIADAIKRSNFQHNHVVINAISQSAGNCYSSVTGYDPNVVIRDIKKMIDENIKHTVSQGNPNPVHNTPNQNQQFQPFNPQVQPPVNPPNFGGPSLPPPNNYHQFQPPLNSNGYGNNHNLHSNNGHPNPPVSHPANSFNNAPTSNNSPPNPLVLPPENSFNNPPSTNNGAFNPSNNPSFVNNGGGTSETSPPNDPEGQRQAGVDFTENQTPSQDNGNSQDNVAALTSTTSQDSEPSDTDFSGNSDETTLSPIAETTQSKTTEIEKPDEEPCDEKFKIALYDTLINDNRFCSYFGVLPISTTKPAVPNIMNHAFEEFGIEQHYTEFSTFWKFESKTLNRESTSADWDEVISKICKIILSRNNLLSKDCEEDGRKMADYILDMLPGDPPASSNPDQNDGNGEVSTESNVESSFTTNAPVEDNSNSDDSTKPENLSFPELHSTLANIFPHDGSDDKYSDKVPFSELLSTFETQQYLARLHRTAKRCKTPSGFDFTKFFGTMTSVADSIQKNHPDWSRDKCQKEMYSATIAVLTKELQDTIKSDDRHEDGKSSFNEPDSTSDSQNAPGDFNLSSDDSTNPGPDTDDNSGNAPEQQQDLTNYGDNPDGTGSSGNQPAPYVGQPPNFGPGPINNNYRDFNDGNTHNAPLPASNYGSQNNGNTFSQTNAQNFPSQDNPASMNTQPHPGNQHFPVNQNTEFHPPPNFGSNSGGINSPNGNYGNNQFQANNHGQNAGQPALQNGNFPNFQPHHNHQGYNSGGPAAENGFQNGNNQQQFNSNSRFPANGPQW